MLAPELSQLFRKIHRPVTRAVLGRLLGATRYPYARVVVVARARCRLCGVVEVEARLVSVRVHKRDAMTYRFQCPTCSNIVAALIDKERAEMLTHAGARISARRSAATAPTQTRLGSLRCARGPGSGKPSITGAITAI
jgi:hypothetical protein